MPAEDEAVEAPRPGRLVRVDDVNAVVGEEELVYAVPYLGREAEER